MNDIMRAANDVMRPIYDVMDAVADVLNDIDDVMNGVYRVLPTSEQEHPARRSLLRRSDIGSGTMTAAIDQIARRRARGRMSNAPDASRSRLPGSGIGRSVAVMGKWSDG